MKNLEELKNTPHLLIYHTAEDGGFGHILFNKFKASVIWSFGGGWEHVSVCPYNKRYTPSWEEMCYIKDMFWHEEEVVVQYHPARSEYVNNLPNCLHLWRPIEEKLPCPPIYMVGIRNGQSISDLKKEIEEGEKNG